MLNMAGLVLLNACSTANNTKVYSLDVDNTVLRRHADPIPFTDSRLRCNDTPDGRECRFLCIAADDLEELISPLGIIDL